MPFQVDKLDCKLLPVSAVNSLENAAVTPLAQLVVGLGKAEGSAVGTLQDGQTILLLGLCDYYRCTGCRIQPLQEQLL